MRPEDIGFGLELCRLAGWNQLEADWRRLLALDPEGVFVAEMAGLRCGTASTTHYGTRSAWIGMVLVHPDFRRQGIGSALMAHCIEYLQALGVESIKLDATDQGRPVYLKLGFRDERPTCRTAAARPAGLLPHPGVRPIGPEEWPAIAARDFAAFGADRTDLLRLLQGEGSNAALVEDGKLFAYGFARPGHNASYLGPLVAEDAESARRVAETLLAALPEGQVYWDHLSENAASMGIAEALGFQVTRRLTRMYLGEEMHPGDVSRVYGLATFELG